MISLFQGVFLLKTHQTLPLRLLFLQQSLCNLAPISCIARQEVHVQSQLFESVLGAEYSAHDGDNNTIGQFVICFMSAGNSRRVACRWLLRLKILVRVEDPVHCRRIDAHSRVSASLLSHMHLDSSLRVVIECTIGLEISLTIVAYERRLLQERFKIFSVFAEVIFVVGNASKKSNL